MHHLQKKLYEVKRKKNKETLRNKELKWYSLYMVYLRAPFAWFIKFMVYSIIHGLFHKYTITTSKFIDGFFVVMFIVCWEKLYLLKKTLFVLCKIWFWLWVSWDPFNICTIIFQIYKEIHAAILVSFLFVCFWFLTSYQLFFSHVGMGLPGLNQY